MDGDQGREEEGRASGKPWLPFKDEWLNPRDETEQNTTVMGKAEAMSS